MNSAQGDFLSGHTLRFFLILQMLDVLKLSKFRLWWLKETKMSLRLPVDDGNQSGRKSIVTDKKEKRKENEYICFDLFLRSVQFSRPAVSSKENHHTKPRLRPNSIWFTLKYPCTS